MQIIKAVLLVVGVGILAIVVLAMHGFDPSRLLGEAVARSPEGEAILAPGLKYPNPLDFFSLGLALVLGTAGLPHVLMRFYTVPTGREARRSVVWAIWIIGSFYVMTLVLGYGAAALVGPEILTDPTTPGGENAAAPLLALEIGGPVLMAVISAIAFATILAVVAGLAITAATSFAHDIYASVIKKGEVAPDDEVKVARWTVVGIGVLAIVGGIVALGQNVAFLVALAFAVAASANLPTILFSLFWKRFNTGGALFSMIGGLVSCLVLIVLSPAVSGSPKAMFPDLDFQLFPLSNPGIVSIPLGFLLGIIGTLVTRPAPDHDVKAAEMEVRSFTGAGAEKAQDH